MLDGFDRLNTILHQDWDARFEKTAQDPLLIRTVASDTPKPVWVSADISQYRKRPDERKALGESGMSAVYVRGGFHDLSYHDQARLLINVWPNVILQCSNCREPTVFEIGNNVRTMKVEFYCLTKELLLPPGKQKRQ